MLASTMQFSRYGRHQPRSHRVSATNEHRQGRHPTVRVVRWEGWSRECASRAIPQDPTVCLMPTAFETTFHSSEAGCTCNSSSHRHQIIDVPHNEQRRLETNARETTNGQPTGVDCRVLLRKEVIQPHLPVRLPCYDFVPIASPTFDGSLHKGWATGFGCCRLS